MVKTLIIFDLDGTLYQAHHNLILAVKEALIEYDLPIPTDEFIISFIGVTMESFCKIIAPTLGLEARNALAERISYYERQFAWMSCRLYSGVNEMLLDFNARGFKLAICSNGSYQYVETVTKACGIFNLFTSIKARTPEKTKSDLIREILEEFEVDNALVVGDSEFDIEAAHNNNLLCIGVTYGYGGNEVLNADYQANNVNELVSHILRINIFSFISEGLKTFSFSSPFVIGINGVDTSGKSIFATAYEKYLKKLGYKTQLVHVDDFHNELSIRTQGDNEVDNYLNHSFNFNVLEDEILAPVRSGKSINKELLLLDLETDLFINKKQFIITKTTVLIIEGVLLYRNPINHYFHKRVFLDVDFDSVLKRASIRDVPKYGEQILDKYRKKYIPAQQKYISEWSPKEKSDIVIDNNDYLRPIMIIPR